ncbi:MAG TPA: Holliday junction resolvase RuvX [Streptosporangiaceae bacterium]
MRQGARLGVDVGSVRIGVASCDTAGLLATPVETVRRGRGDYARIAEIASEYDVIEIVVGLPTSLSGDEGPAAKGARAFAARLDRRVPGVDVRLFDERLTTVSAHAGLRASGVRGRDRKAVVDQAAATILLQAALDAERLTGRPAGEKVGANS